LTPTPTASPTPTPTVTPSPTPTDTDLDGKPDDCETNDAAAITAPSSVETHIYLPDSDGDGLLDGQEDPGTCTTALPPLALTNPRIADTDEDGFSDGVEVLLLSTNPLNPDDPDKSNPDYADGDGDGLPVLIDPDDTKPDTDEDGFGDAYEMTHASDADNDSIMPALGDVNCDSVTNNVDAIMIFQWALGNLASLPCIQNSDVSINALPNNVDAIFLFQWTLGNVPIIP
jgi:hypothetical protein